MKKVQSLTSLARILSDLRVSGEKVALITGCFDVVHLGHVRMFKFAKKHAGIVVVGVENDANIRTTKGADRPIHDYRQRIEVLAELESVSYVFLIKLDYQKAFLGENTRIQAYWAQILSILKPDFLVTNAKTDRIWPVKKRLPKKWGQSCYFIVAGRKYQLQRLQKK